MFSWQGEKQVNMSPMDSLAYYKRYLRAGFLAVNPLNGYVKAWVGGPNYKYFKFDHVRQGKRQPGSTFKPIVYTAAIDQGYSPCFPRPDVATTFPGVAGRAPYTPKNFEGSFSGRTFTLRQALARSMNSITAMAGAEAGARNGGGLRQAARHYLAHRRGAGGGLRGFRLQHLRAGAGPTARSSTRACGPAPSWSRALRTGTTTSCAASWPKPARP
ncbi:MAG: penicillin-binding transpeptidase domain-containing protein [Hymenobacter sp.]